MKTRLNILYNALCTTCSDLHVIVGFFYSLKAFETLVQEIIKNCHLTGANVETTHQVHTIPQYVQRFSMYMYWKIWTTILWLNCFRFKAYYSSKNNNIHCCYECHKHHEHCRKKKNFYYLLMSKKLTSHQSSITPNTGDRTLHGSSAIIVN